MDGYVCVCVCVCVRESKCRTVHHKLRMQQAIDAHQALKLTGGKTLDDDLVSASEIVKVLDDAVGQLTPFQIPDYPAPQPPPKPDAPPGTQVDAATSGSAGNAGNAATSGSAGDAATSVSAPHAGGVAEPADGAAHAKGAEGTSNTADDKEKDAKPSDGQTADDAPNTEIRKTEAAVEVGVGEVWIVWEDVGSVPRKLRIFRDRLGNYMDKDDKPLDGNPFPGLVTEVCEDGTFIVTVHHDKTHVPRAPARRAHGKQLAEGSRIEGVVRKQFYGFVYTMGDTA